MNKQKKKWEKPVEVVPEQEPKITDDPLLPQKSLTPPMGVKIHGLPCRPTLRVSEVAAYYGVTERTVYLWIEHGHLQTEKTPMGQWRVTRESLDLCRFAKPGENHLNNRSERFK